MKIKIPIFSLCVIMLFSIVLPITSYAQSPASVPQATMPANVGQCDTNPYSVSEPVDNFAGGASVYIRLNAASEVSTPVNVYLQNLSDMSCKLIGSTTAVINNWAKVTSDAKDQKLNGVVIITYSAQENVEVYQASFQLLFLANKSICSSVTTACNTTFNSYGGVLTVPTSSKAK